MLKREVTILLPFLFIKKTKKYSSSKKVIIISFMYPPSYTFVYPLNYNQ